MTKRNTAVQISERMAAVVSGSTRRHRVTHTARTIPCQMAEMRQVAAMAGRVVKHVNNGLHRLALLPYIVRGFGDCYF